MESEAILIGWSFLTVITIGDMKNWLEQFVNFSICPLRLTIFRVLVLLLVEGGSALFSLLDV